MEVDRFKERTTIIFTNKPLMSSKKEQAPFNPPGVAASKLRARRT